jgi:hypothetical protein
MINLNPRETQNNELNAQVNTLVLINETVARLDFDAVLEDGTLTIQLCGVTLGKPGEAETPAPKRRFVLQ